MKFVWVLLVLGSFAGAHASTLFETDIDKAVARAKAQKKPLLIDFYGIWCPPCNELDETVFSTPGFVEKAKRFVLLKVDADAQNSWKLKDKYKVGGYPTVVFADFQGNEIHRIVGYKPAPEFTKIMDAAVSMRGKPLAKACASKNTDDLWRCALICSERDDKACAEKAFRKLESKLQPGTARYDMAQTYFVEKEENLELKKLTYENLLEQSPQSPSAIFWSLGYLDMFNDEKKLTPKKHLVESVIANADVILKDPRRTEVGLTETDLAQMKAELLSAVGKKDDAKKAWKEAADLLAKAASEVPAGSSTRGFTLERIGALEGAGEFDAALKLAEEYRARYPGEFTFHFQAASMLLREKKYAQALPIAKLAYEKSYGDNKIRAAILLVRLHNIHSDRAASKKIVDEVKGEIKPDAALEVRTHRYLKQLNDTMQNTQGKS